jgi:hypothetical protein
MNKPNRDDYELRKSIKESKCDECDLKDYCYEELNPFDVPFNNECLTSDRLWKLKTTKDGK